jgi:hypothetical protein
LRYALGYLPRFIVPPVYQTPEMSGLPNQTAQDVEARAQLEKATSGRLATIGKYSLRETNKGEKTVALADVIVDNCSASPGEDLEVYADLREGFAVIDLGDGVGGYD